MSYFSISPSVEFTETDLTTGLTAVASTVGALAGDFEWGPVLDPVQVTEEADLVDRFGKPNDRTYGSWYTAYNFLQYSSDIRVVRALSASAKNAVTTGTPVVVQNLLDWESKYSNGGTGVGVFAAKWPGARGNNFKVSMADAATYTRNIPGTATLTANSATLVGQGTSFTSDLTVGDVLTFVKNGTDVLTPGGSLVTLSVVSITDDLNVVLSAAPGVASVAATVQAKWEYSYIFPTAPQDSDQALFSGSTGDGLHAVVVDATGAVTGTKNSVIEAFANISKASNARKFDGTVAYYKNAFRDSKTLWWMDHPASSLVDATGIDFGSPTGPGTFKNLQRPLTYTLQQGSDGLAATDGELQTAFSFFGDAEKYDVRLLMSGKVSATVSNFVIHNVAEVRRDCIAFVSPNNVADGTPVVGDTSENIDKLTAFRTLMGSSSYGFLDSGYKYQYDKYADKYRYIPLNGDMAGLMARTAAQRNEWASPAGFNRGVIKNVTRLAINPKKEYRDRLFPVDVNSVVLFPNSGPTLFSDKTLIGRPSDFDAINIRMLFILLEKSIATSARYFLFEQNTELTRKLFVSFITPFLRSVQGQGGISDFLIDVGPNVNNAATIQSKTFAANIYIKPAKAIRFIKLNFVATPEGVSFSEITGQSNA